MRLIKSTLAASLAITLLATPPGVHAAENRKPTVKPPAAPSVANNAARAEQETNLAAQAYQAGDYPVAIEHFNKVVKLAPNDVMAWHFLGQSLAKTGDVMGARRAYARVLELQPEGQVADRTRELLAKLPEPDLFKIQLDSGLTLGDWMPVAQQQAAQGKREAVLREIAQYLKQIGPVPQLLALQAKLQQEAQAEQEQRIRSAISALKVKDADTAKATLPQIRQLKAQAPDNLTLLKLEAKACHLMQDFTCAEAAYAAWLKAAPGNDAGRKQMVAALMQAKQREALPRITAMEATGEIIRDCPACPEMVVISAGSFEMGEPDAKHTVTFAKPFAIGKTEVTQGQWKAVMGSNSNAISPPNQPTQGLLAAAVMGSLPPKSHFSNCGDNCPVENVSWNDAQEFIKKLNTKTGKQYRLPTEAEWEAACRGGEEQEYCGSDDVNSVAWYGFSANPKGNSGETTNPVGTKQANAFGLYDMSGNVWEWVEDSWHDNYNGAPADGSAWQGDGAKRVLRGGSWNDVPQLVRAADRIRLGPAYRFSSYGFRLARTLP